MRDRVASTANNHKNTRFDTNHNSGGWLNSVKPYDLVRSVE